MSRASPAAFGLLIAIVIASAGGTPGLGAAASPEPGSARGGAAESYASLLGALRVADPFERAGRLAALLPTLGPRDVAHVRRILNGTIVPLGGVEIGLLTEFWARHDPEGAGLWGLRRAPMEHRADATRIAVGAWARADPSAALAAVRDLLQYAALASVNGRAAEIALVSGWLDSGQPGLEDYIHDLGPGIPRQRAIAAFARSTIGREGGKAIVRWVEALPDEDGTYKLEAFRQVALELGMLDPPAGVAFCEAHCGGPYGDILRKLIAQRWAGSDCVSAMKWLSGAPGGKQRDWAVAGAFSSCWRSDSDTFETWLRSQTSGGVEPWLVPAIPLYANMLGRKDPEAAFEWIARIPDEKVRERSYINVARNWWRRDEPAAEAWLAHAPLSEEAMAKVRAPARPPGETFRLRGSDEAGR